MSWLPRNLCLGILLSGLNVSLSNAAENQPAKAAGPLTPTEALAHFQVAPGLTIELVASEPQVVDPVAVRFDERGRMWVVEMRDYPHGPAEGEAPESRIKILEDLDQDGHFESAKVFASGLLFCNGVQPWKNGAIATMAGEVAFFADDNDDGQADRKETWYQGFAEENSQLRANHPRLGLDHHVYIANGLRGGSVIDPRRAGAEAVSLSGKDFRFHPETFEYEAITGVGQYGLTFDDYGNRFVCSNRNPLKHIVLPEKLLKQNPHYAPPVANHDVAKAGAESRVFPISRAWTTSNLHAGQFTAACGVHIYRGNGLPRAFLDNGFICDPTGNLVHREVLHADGVTFRSEAGRAGVEFLASPDEWFRPVNLGTGPDGALIVVDMYRAVIEHPRWVPDELKERPDLFFGTDRGRIYRVRGKDLPRQAMLPGRTSSKELVELLAHANVWQREMAARLLFERQDDTATLDLETVSRWTDSAQAQVLALWALQGMHRLSESTLLTALRDAHPRVREQAIRLSAGIPTQRVRAAVQALAEDRDPRVRFSVAEQLAGDASAAATEALGRMAAFVPLDVWLARSVAIASCDRADRLLAAMVRHLTFSDELSEERQQLLVTLVELSAQQDDASALRVLEVVFTAAQPAEELHQKSMTALISGLRRRRQSLDALMEQSDPTVRARVAAIFREAYEVADHKDKSVNQRSSAIAMLAYDPTARPMLVRIATDSADRAIRTNAISALSGGQEPDELDPWKTLLEGFVGESPAIRREILDGVLARTNRTSLLLDHIENGSIRVTELDQSTSNRLLQSRDAEIQRRAKRLLADAIPADRKQVLAEYQVALELKGDVQRGQQVFAKNCSTCHRIAEVGTDVAPDISDSRTRKPEQLLTDILQPNRAIDNNYVSYSVLTVDGVQHTGILVSETANAITLRQTEGKEVTLVRGEVEELRSNGVSLMPVGLERTIPPQAMADLIRFIKHWRYLDGRTPLGTTD